jgi:hypothetical protein
LREQTLVRGGDTFFAVQGGDVRLKGVTALVTSRAAPALACRVTAALCSRQVT